MKGIAEKEEDPKVKSINRLRFDESRHMNLKINSVVNFESDT